MLVDKILKKVLYIAEQNLFASKEKQKYKSIDTIYYI